MPELGGVPPAHGRENQERSSVKPSRATVARVPGQWARNPKRVSTPFDPEYGEFSLHYSYNYPELLKVIK